MPELTVDQLRTLISGLPGSMRVIVDGYEGGANDPYVGLVEAQLNVRKQDYMGPHEYEGKYYEGDVLSQQVLLISRREILK